MFLLPFTKTGQSFQRGSLLTEGSLLRGTTISPFAWQLLGCCTGKMETYIACHYKHDNMGKQTAHVLLKPESSRESGKSIGRLLWSHVRIRRCHALVICSVMPLWTISMSNDNHSDAVSDGTTCRKHCNRCHFLVVLLTLLLPWMPKRGAWWIWPWITSGMNEYE